MARSNTIRQVALFAALVIAVTGICSASSTKADTVMDYLIQQVCLDSNNQPTSQDPLTCNGTVRKLNIGESLPYHKWDSPTQTSTSQISDSYPVADYLDRLRVIQTMYFTFTDYNPVFDAGDFVAGKAAYDVLVADGDYVSLAGTYDDGRGWQPFWQNWACSLSDSWIQFPKGNTIPFSQGSTTATLNNSSPQCYPNSNFQSSLTIWNFYSNYEYQSLKELDTIKTWHFSGNSLNTTSFEVFYYTKQYGKSRWESWNSTQDQDKTDKALLKCGRNLGSGSVVFGTTTYYLYDCHDWTWIFPASTPWSPASWHVDPLYVNENLLQNTHMQCTNSSGQAADCGTSAPCQTITPWERTGDINWALSNTGFTGEASANCNMKMAVPTTPTTQSVYQNIDISNIMNTSFSYGVALWSNGTSSAADIKVFEFNSLGALIGAHSTTANLTSSRKFFSGSFTKTTGATYLRFQIYPSNINDIYQMTDAWVTSSP